MDQVIEYTVQIIEKVSNPIKLKSLPNIGVGIGDIVSLYYDESNAYCTLSNSRNPFGLVVSERDEWDMLSVLHSTAILKTNYYDSWETYNVGDFLYSDDYGLLTKRKCDENAILLGRVLTPPINNDSPMEISWI